MLRSLKQLYGDTLRASDGDIGHIKDFYFDDQSWVVRYVVVDTGSWLPGRLVLISPHVLRNFDLDGVCRGVDLTRQQIEESPPIEAHLPVSRQYEEAYYRHYGWPNYWSGDGLWGVSDFPIVEQDPAYKAENPSSGDGDDPHLRSTKAISGYQIQTDEGALGHVIDFIVHNENWAIRHLVVETGHWYSGKEIVISPEQVDRISYEESKVFVNVTREAILKAPEYHVPPWAYQDSLNPTAS
jgi:uncharacterized protein YrrD